MIIVISFTFVKPIFLYTLESKCDSHILFCSLFFRFTNHFATHFAEKRKIKMIWPISFIFIPQNSTVLFSLQSKSFPCFCLFVLCFYSQLKNKKINKNFHNQLNIFQKYNTFKIADKFKSIYLFAFMSVFIILNLTLQASIAKRKNTCVTR